MIGQSGSHGWGTGTSEVVGLTQFVIRETEDVGAADQVHAGFQGIQALGSMTAFACQAGEPFSHRPIQPFDKRRMPDGSSLRLLQQIVGLLLLSPT